MGKIAYTRTLSNGEIAAYDEEGINYDDIPEITDFSRLRKDPERAMRLKRGYTVIIEHDGYNEVRKYDFAKIPKPQSGLPIPYEVAIEKAAPG